MLDKTVQPTNQYIIIQANFSRESDAKLIGKKITVSALW
jgi:hypothetical protein